MRQSVAPQMFAKPGVLPGRNFASAGLAMLLLVLLLGLGVTSVRSQVSDVYLATDLSAKKADDFESASVSPGHTVITLTELSGAGHLSIPGNTTIQLFNLTANRFDGRLTGNGVLEKRGIGDLTFSSISNTNTFHFAGTVALFNGSLGFEGGSARNSLTLGTLQLTGGTLSLNSAYINVDTLNITGNTILDFGTGAGSILNARNIYIAEGATLTVKNWSSEVDFLFANSSFRQDDRGGTSAEFNVTGTAPQNQIVFEGADGGSTAWLNYDYNGYANFEIRPIPEPSTYGAIITGLSLGLVAWRRRRKSGSSTSS